MRERAMFRPDGTPRRGRLLQSFTGAGALPGV